MQSNIPALPAKRYSLATSVRAVLFDAVGTLISPNPPVAEAYCAAGRRFGSRLEIDQVQTRFRAAFVRQEQLDAAEGPDATSEERERRRWQSIVGEVFCDLDDTRPLFEALWGHFALAEHWRLFDDVPLAWTRLRQAHLQIGVASNFDGRLESIMADIPLSPPPGQLFISSQLGCRKPSPAFFRAVERSLGLQPEQLLLVGDDLVNDYYGARAAGWQAVLLARRAAAPQDVEHWITSLDELDIAS